MLGSHLRCLKPRETLPSGVPEHRIEGLINASIKPHRQGFPGSLGDMKGAALHIPKYGEIACWAATCGAWSLDKRDSLLGSHLRCLKPRETLPSGVPEHRIEGLINASIKPHRQGFPGSLGDMKGAALHIPKYGEIACWAATCGA